MASLGSARFPSPCIALKQTPVIVLFLHKYSSVVSVFAHDRLFFHCLYHHALVIDRWSFLLIYLLLW